MTEEDIKFRQGRSKKQVESSYMGAFYSLVGMVLTIIVYLILK